MILTRREQRAFVIDLTKHIRVTILQKIRDGKIPEDWDGTELRELIYDYADDARSKVMKEKPSRRLKEYKNTCLVNNLI